MPPLATPPIGKGAAIGGSGCPHRFRGAALEQVPRTVPPTSAPPAIAPPKVAPPKTDFDTPRSPSLKEDWRSSPPSTVPQVLSGTPGSPGALLPGSPDEGLCGAAGVAGSVGLSTGPTITTEQLRTLDNMDHNWKFRRDVSRGAHADFVHVDEDELPNGLQALRCDQPTAASSANRMDVGSADVQTDLGSADVRTRGPLSMDCDPDVDRDVLGLRTSSRSNVMASNDASVDVSNVSFNLSPIKRPAAGRSASCGEESGCSNNGCARPPSPLMGVHVPPPQPTDPVVAPRRFDGLSDENRENIVPVRNPESKVSQMRNFWEQRSASQKAPGRGRASSATANSTAGRGRSSSREREEQRVRRASLSQLDPKLYRRMKKEEEETKSTTRCLEDLVRDLDLRGAEQTVSDLDTSMTDALDQSSTVEDSPTDNKYKCLYKSTRASWRRQQKICKTLIQLLGAESGRANIEPFEAGAAVEAPATTPAASTELPQHAPLPPARDILTSLNLPADKAVPEVTKGHSPPATPQPEEEADGPLPRKSGVEDTALLRRKSKLLAAEEALHEHPMIESSRNSTLSDAEPAREPQPLGQSPRDRTDDLSSSTETPMLESPEGPTSSSYARPSASEPEPQEGLVPEVESSMNSSGLGEEESANIDQSIDDALADYSSVRPGEEGMERAVTMLHMIEQGELKRELYIMVPEGIGPDRKVQFSFENRSHEVIVPDGYEVGAQVLVTISNRPFLERTINQGLRRGHPHPEFADRYSIIDNLRHSLRTDVDNSNLGADEFRNRYNLYMLLRGRCGAPLLPFTEEEKTPVDALSSP